MFSRFDSFTLLFAVSAASVQATLADDAAQKPPAIAVPNVAAKSESEMKAYTEPLRHTTVKIEMVPIKGGTFLMGSPDTEANRNKDEGPRNKVSIAPFWMGKTEITWDAYETWGEETDIILRDIAMEDASPRDELADAVTRPTPPYTDMSFGMGKGKKPAICMTQHAARTFCKWLSEKTGRYYRLPTEAEWEYACRAGSTTAYHFGDDPSKLGDYAWYFENSEGRYQTVGTKKPNAWGLHDMHGNAAEWVLDQYIPKLYLIRSNGPAKNPLMVPTKLYPRVVRGGGWDDPANMLRSAVREGSNPKWKKRDPQNPKSIWYHTDARGVGFRVVRPLVEPSENEKAAKWEKTAPIQLDPEED